MNITRERKIEEAVKRMKAFDIIDDAISQFKDDGVLMVTEPPLGGLYYIDEEQRKLVDEFEEKHNAVVYMIVRCYSEIGKMDSILFVSDYEEEWEMDMDDAIEGFPMTYTYNYDSPYCSEFGTIGVRKIFGGLLRTD